MIAPDLFEFAYVPDWYGHLAELERLALPESWKFRKPSRETKNTDTPILERYIHTIFRKQVIDFNSESDPRKADSIFHLENECVCFHTGLYTRQYKGIYGYFERNNFSDSLRDWYFRGFCDEMSPKLRCKKVAIFCLVGIGHVLDTQVIQNGSVLRTAVIFFYLSNEGISIIENVALIGLPVPKKLKEVLEQLHEEADEKKEDE